MHTRVVIVAAIAALCLSLPSMAHAAAPSKAATSTYALDFTLPTAGKSGCMVCHGDPNLIKVAGETTATVYINVRQLESSAHKADLCTGCHIDFAYTSPHQNTKGNNEWTSVAKLACKNCKEHKVQFTEYAAGAHSPAGQPGVSASQTAAARLAKSKPANTPLCGDCHLAHAIPSKEDTAARLAYQRSGLRVCGSCHTKEADTYSDYYHGAAYRRGAADAPACWDCHGTHEILPVSDRRSMVNARNLIETCGQKGCHSDVDEESETFVGYAKYVHGRDRLLAENPVWALYDSARRGVKGAFETITSWFGKG